MSICLVDTSVLVEVLGVPRKSNRHGAVHAELRDKVNGGEKMFLPLGVIFETGNHVAQGGDGRQRRACAESFVRLVGDALAGKSPFIPVGPVDVDSVRAWLKDFPDSAMKRQMGLVDISIESEFRRLCELHQGHAVYVWSLDKAHLSSLRRDME